MQACAVGTRLPRQNILLKLIRRFGLELFVASWGEYSYVLCK